MVTDINASIKQQILYSPFGEVITEYNAYWHNGKVLDYMFNAKEVDSESGMYYYSARYYNPPTFISRDPLFEKYPFMAPYAYCANNPVKLVDPDGKKIRFPKGTSREFKEQAIATANYMTLKGMGGNLQKVIQAKQIVYIAELKKEDKAGPRFDPQTMTLYWSPTIGLETTNGVTLSPLTVADHELDHTQQYLYNTQQFIKDATTPDKNYGNKEEKRVITGSEQTTATKMGEIDEHEVTRTNHKGRLIETSSPTSNKDINRKEVIIRAKRLENNE
jgi:RHS repeat-associated protein